jgi:hypothetical protein
MKKYLFFILLILTEFNLDMNAQTGRELTFQKWALTPPMGWNSWDCYGPSVIEDQVKANANYMATHLKQYGWEYIVVDIRWYVDNQKGGAYNDFKKSEFIIDEFGRYLPSPKRFPSSVNGAGFKPLADYIHSKGLKFGIHIMRGVPVTAVNQKLPIKASKKTAADIYSTELQCSWLRDNYTVLADKEGAQEYYNSIFELYSSWGVDFVKVDDLARPYHQGEIEMIRNAIDKTGRAMVLSMSPGETPVAKVEHARTHANMWRTVDDFWDRWPLLSYQFEICNKWAPYITPGAWPDADMLPLGQIEIYNDGGKGRWTKFSKAEQYNMMTLWTIFKSPLIFGGNMPQNDEFTNSLLTNKEVLAAHKYSVNNCQWFNQNGQVGWTADDPTSGDKYVALFNNGDDGFIDQSCSLYRSGNISRLSTNYGVNIDLPLSGESKELFLIVNDGGDGNTNDFADWINPTLYKTNGDSIKLTDLNWEYANSGRNHVVKFQNASEGALTVNGSTYNNGIGTHSKSIILFEIPKGCVRFKAFAGLDKAGTDQTDGASVEFMIAVKDPKVKNFDINRANVHSGRISKTMQREGVNITANITGAKKLYLVVSEAGDNPYYDHADWINPMLYKANGDSLSLTSLKWVNATSGFGNAQVNLSVDSKPLTVNGKTYTYGIGTHANSAIEFDLPSGYTRFKSYCGFDDEVLKSNFGTTVEFFVFTQNPANYSESPLKIDLKELGYKGNCRIRNLWAQKDTGVFSGTQFAPKIEIHGASLYRISSLEPKEGIAMHMSASKVKIISPDSLIVDVKVWAEKPGEKLTGSVVFMQNVEIVGIVPIDSLGKAQYIAYGLKPGVYTFTARYSGNTNYSPKDSNKITVKVEKK